MLLPTILWAVFQSPRSGQICSNSYKSNPSDNFQEKSFNPLDRVKFVQIGSGTENMVVSGLSFNPLDRVKFVQISAAMSGGISAQLFTEFQSPRSGQICSNGKFGKAFFDKLPFQSPRSGQICSNLYLTLLEIRMKVTSFNPLDRVKFVQILYRSRRS